MNNLKSTWFVGIILIGVLFIFTVYPTISVFTNVPVPFQLVFRILLFIAILSLIIYLFVELSNLQKRHRELTDSGSVGRSGEREREAEQGIGLNLQLDPKKNYDAIAARLIELIRFSLMAQRVFIYLYDPDDKRYVFQFSSDDSDRFKAQFAAEGEIFRSYHLEPRARLMHARQFEITQLTYAQEPPKVGTLMLAPIILAKGPFIGFIGLESVDKEAWGNEDLDLVRSFANLFSSTLLQIDAIDLQKNTIQFFKELTRLNFEIPLGIDNLELYKKATAVIRKFFDFDKLCFATFHHDTNEELVLEYVEGTEADYSIGHQIQPSGGLWEAIIDRNIPVRIGDYDKSKIQFRMQPGDLSILPFRSCLGISLTTAEAATGGILLESYRASNYTQNDSDTLTLFAKSLSEILNRIKTYQSMKDLAMIDGLTGIYNHRAFKERLQIEIDRSRRYDSPITLLILDLDKFKRINDTYGHLQGDYVLKKTANIIRGSVRTVDTVARYGGEEFAVILINAEKQACMKTADRICRNVQDFIFEKGNMKEQITISAGLAEYPTDGETLPALVANADMAMYQAKRAGGNQAVIFNNENAS